MGEILEPYDYDKKYPVFGFGAEPDFLGKKLSHCFPLTGKQDQIEVSGGIKGVLAIYRHTLPHIELAGPTLFAPLLTEFKKYVVKNNG